MRKSVLFSRIRIISLGSGSAWFVPNPNPNSTYSDTFINGLSTEFPNIVKLNPLTHFKFVGPDTVMVETPSIATFSKNLLRKRCGTEKAISKTPTRGHGLKCEMPKFRLFPVLRIQIRMDPSHYFFKPVHVEAQKEAAEA